MIMILNCDYRYLKRRVCNQSNVGVACLLGVDKGGAILPLVIPN